TLHPKVHGGLLFRRDLNDHVETAAEHGILPIDLLVVNLYPFEQVIRKSGVTVEEAVENIDIGGPSMLRSAAKNHTSVTVVTDPLDYAEVSDQIQSSGNTPLELRKRLSVKVYARTAAYDRVIAEHFEKAYSVTDAESETSLPELLVLESPKTQALRYGENPHQAAALYGDFNDFFQQLHGKALSFNNILDLTAATSTISEFKDESPTLAILKHTNPCGVGQGDCLNTAWKNAFETDKKAPFGGIIASNTEVDEATASSISEIFSEVIVAPGFSSGALSILQKKKNLRLIKIVQWPQDGSDKDVRSVGAGSYLVQQKDRQMVGESDLKIVTIRQPTDEELHAMMFGWKIVKHVKSNAIIYTANDRTLGVGAGQMSRVDSSRIAVWKAGEAGLSLAGSVVCSDAFFPFADGLIAAAEAGATAAIQPGGSMRDQEVIDAADERGLAMAFTSYRHFRH
ncbi:MAG TPA: bifunctional phosphoribosylaminoimidazolecarboxamide formyltransferase/IMP cyclohydrolase, partial [Verrucomicrobia bacterium]|nr:bifunctional phosphoribosylaminoimidazolecarboxamide formyltransferase/IMP cyclohydrolase [Verrucomicrobiota bacterium]